MKKVFTVVLALISIIALASCGIESSGNSSGSESKEPQEIPIETVTELIQSAESVYQLGNYDVLTLAQYEIQFIEDDNILYYDEISNYEEVVPTIFNDNGIKGLEASNILFAPAIVKQNGKVYRASSMSDSAATVFFRTIRSIELVEQYNNMYVYKVVHVAEPRRPEYSSLDEAPSMESTVTIAEENGKFLIDEFLYPLAVSTPSVGAEKLVQDFSYSVVFDHETGTLSFTIPKGLSPEDAFYIHVSGRVKMGDGGMSFHLFEEESESNGWEPGKTYNHEFEKDTLLEALIVVGVQGHGKAEILYETQINIDESGNIKRSDNILTINDAKKILSTHLADNYSFEDGSDYLVYENEISVFDTDCFLFDWRSGKEGIEYHLIQSFAISIDGEKIFYYDAGKDAWFEDN